MHILKDHIGSHRRQIVDHPGHCFFISRNRIGAEDNRISRFDRNFFVYIGRHSGQRRHRLSLTSRCNQNDLFIRIIFHFIDINQGFLRNIQISQLRRRSDDIDHTAPFHHNFSSVFVCRVDDLLYPIYIRRECCDDNSRIFMLCKQIIDGFSNGPLGHGKPFALRIGTVAHQSQHAFFTDLRKSLKINGITKYRRIIHLEISRMNNNAGRRINSQSRSICDTVICLDKFNTKTAQIDRLSMFDGFSFCSTK